MPDAKTGPAITPEIAAVTQTPPGYSAKVLQTLARAGLVSSQRGLYGGFVLTRPPEKITVLDVIQAVDPLPRIRTCPLGLKTHGVRLCPLHRELDQALALVERAFARATIAKLLEPTPGTSVALCENRTPQARQGFPAQPQTSGETHQVAARRPLVLPACQRL